MVFLYYISATTNYHVQAHRNIFILVLGRNYHLLAGAIFGSGFHMIKSHN